MIIPASLREEMKHKAHEAHQGIEVTLSFARDVMFWPHIKHDLENVCRGCSTCQEAAACQQAQPMMSYPIAEFPFQIVSSDIFEYQRKQFIVIVDHYSDYLEVDELKGLTSSEIIKHFQNAFARHGIPLLLITDSGTNYTSQEFQQFVAACDVRHVTSSPHHHQSNGKAEAAVKTTKNLLKKAQPLWISLMNQRNTPTQLIGLSPN